MDKIFILIILFLVFKSIYRFLTEMPAQKRGDIPHHPPSRPPLPGIPREPGAEAHEDIPLPPTMDDEEERIDEFFYTIEHAQASDDTSVAHQTMPDGRVQDETGKDGDTILPYFGHTEGQALIRQGIILAEILGPSVSRRRRMIPPYLRG